jgi:hypothetical protein
MIFFIYEIRKSQVDEKLFMKIANYFKSVFGEMNNDVGTLSTGFSP